MAIKVRQGVFETNSSSSHSLSLPTSRVSKPLKQNLRIGYTGVVKYDYASFSDTQSKLNFLCALLSSELSDKKVIEKKMLEYLHLWGMNEVEKVEVNRNFIKSPDFHSLEIIDVLLDEIEWFGVRNFLTNDDAAVYIY